MAFRKGIYALIHEVRRVWVDKDESRKLLTLMAEGRDKTSLPARALSAGTLRVLALATLELDSREGLLCFEEPENGIHPERIAAMSPSTIVDAGTTLRRNAMSTNLSAGASTKDSMPP